MCFVYNRNLDIFVSIDKNDVDKYLSIICLTFEFSRN